MNIAHHDASQASLISLEAAASTTRGGFACMFSTSDEYESALITQRRAEGRYQKPHSIWPIVAFAGCCLMLTGAVLLFG